MKVFKIMIVAMLLLLSIPTLTTSAAKAEKFDKQEYRELFAKVKELVKQGRETDVEKLPEVISLKQKLLNSPELYISYMSSLDANNEKLFKEKTKDITLGKNDEKIVEFDDGSFVVLKTSTVKDLIQPVLTNLSRAIRKSYTGSFGSNWTTDQTKEIWGVYKAAELHLVTKYTVNQSSIRINSAGTGGTYAIFPTSITSAQSSIINNNASYVSSQGNYTQVDGISIGGQTVGVTHYWTLVTNISIISSTSSTVTFNVTTSVN